jgi:hypothetical protein
MRSRWFVRRRIGFGWRPASWQGWLLSAVLLGVALTSLAVLRPKSLGVLVVVAAVAVYTLVAALTSRGQPAP